MAGIFRAVVRGEVIYKISGVMIRKK